MPSSAAEGNSGAFSGLSIVRRVRQKLQENARVGTSGRLYRWAWGLSPRALIRAMGGSPCVTYNRWASRAPRTRARMSSVAAAVLGAPWLGAPVVRCGRSPE